MSTTVRSTGFNSNDVGTSGGRLAFNLSNGNAIVIMRDVNNAAGTGGDHTGVEKIYIYESSDRSTWTLRATIAIPAATYRITAALFANNDIALWHEASPRTTVRYARITYATWAVGAWETVATAGTNETYQQLDGTVSDGNVPMLSVVVSNSVSPDNIMRLYTKRTSDNTWVLSQTFSDGSAGAPALGCSDTSITCLTNNISSGLRKVIWAFASGDANSDHGVDVVGLEINESTGAAAATYTSIATAALAGEALKGSARLQGRHISVYQDTTQNNDDFIVCVSHSEVNRAYRVLKGRFTGIVINGGTSSILLNWSGSYSGYSAANIGDRGLAITFNQGSGSVVFHFASNNVSGVTKKALVEYHVIIRYDLGSTLQYLAQGHFKWDNLSRPTADNYLILGGGDRNLQTGQHDTAILANWTNTNQTLYHHYARITTSPTQVKPSNGAVMVDSNPDLASDMNAGILYPQSPYRMRWQFAKDSLFSTSLNDYPQPLGSHHDLSSTSVVQTYRMNDKLPLNVYTLAQGTWFARAAMFDDLGAQGPYSSNISFTITHPPAPTGLTPTGGIQLVYGTGTKQFQWVFTDPSDTDYQTAYQLQIIDNTTSTTFYDTGKVASISNLAIATLASTYKDKSLGWRVKLYDRDDVAGSWADYALFSVADPPSVTITSPANGGTVTSGVPSVTFTPTVGGTRRIKQYVVNIMQGSTLIWSTGTKNVDLASGTPVTVSGDKSYLTNSQSYSIVVTVTDDTGLQGTSPAWGFVTAWTPPAAPTITSVGTTQYNVDGAGYITVTWPDTARDADFSAWVIYREDDEIDPNTQAVLLQRPLVEVGRVYDTATTYTYTDYLAPSNNKVSYVVRQEVNRFGDVVESTNVTPTSVFPKSEGYWLVQPSTSPLIAVQSMKLYNVTDDSYTDEYEAAEYTVIGRGRHVDQGQRLGYKGSLTAQLRDSTANTARMKKNKLEAIRDTPALLYLRTPFGDTFRVAVGDLGVSRIAGVGLSEFVDVTIPYSEVSL